jgi:hypothetical protein
MRMVYAWRRENLETCVLLAATTLVLSACGRQAHREYFPVEGILMVDGSPAANASVAFHPLNSDKNASCAVGRTDHNGKFRLTTNSTSDGAPLGDYAVTVVWIDETISRDECEDENPLIHDQLKGYYAHAELTELRATVRPSGNLFCLHTRRPPGDELPFSKEPSLNPSREIRRGFGARGAHENY